MVQTLRSRRSYPSLSDCIGSGRPERRANLLYSDAPHATVEARTIAAVAIVNQKSRWRVVPDAVFHDLLCGPVRRGMLRHFNVENLSTSLASRMDEEDAKRLQQDRRDAEKVASPHVRCMPRQELSPRPVGAWPRRPRIYLATVLAET
jgi:hypothetical protein